MSHKPVIVFAGGGHAHLYSLRRTAALIQAGYEVILVNPESHLYYSGMATGVVSGLYSPEQSRLNVQRMVENGGGRFVEGHVEKVVPEERILLLEGGERLSYDVASFCVGSEVERCVGSIPVKPVSNAALIRNNLKEPGVRAVIAGGGVAGCEIAANAAERIEQTNPTATLTLVESGPELLATAPRKARREISDYLRGKNVQIILNSRVVSHDAGIVRLDTGRSLAADVLILATGTLPPPLFSRSNVLTDEDGRLWVNHYLRSPNHPKLFGGGDAISFRGGKLPGLGVYAIRQGPILFHNIRATLKGEPLAPFLPQKRYLYVLNLGDGTGLGIRGGFSWRGRSAMKLKHLIDQRFMREYGNLDDQ
jgi:NADH dehydrogenase FAD-containing subunit